MLEWNKSSQTRMCVVGGIIWYSVVKPCSWLTLVDRVSPQETLQSCWCLSWPLRRRSGKEGVSLEPGCADLPVSCRGTHRKQNIVRNKVSTFLRLHACLCAPSPLEIDRRDVEHDSFEPKDHEEALGEGTVADAFPVAARLCANKRWNNLWLVKYCEKPCKATRKQQSVSQCFNSAFD